MDFGQFLAEAPLGAILGLAVIPLLAALALVGYIVFSFTRRSKKSKMKLGLQAGQKEANTMAKAPKKPVTAVDALPAETSATPGGDLNRALSAADDPPPDQNFEPEPLDLSGRLNMAAAPEPPPQPQAAPPAANVFRSPAAGEPVELLRLLRQPESGYLLVEIAGQRFTKLAEIKERKLGQYVLRLAAQLLAFTGGAILTEAGVKSVAAPPPAPLPEPPFTPPTRGVAGGRPTDSGVPPPPPEVEAAFLASLAQPPAKPSPPPKRGGGLGLGGKPKPASVLSAGELLELNLASEINEVVQKNLARSPLAATNQVKIVSNPDAGGLRIFVNQQPYASPEDIPDEAVKKLIKDSIKEWERS